jgi:cell division protein FtsQ
MDGDGRILRAIREEGLADAGLAQSHAPLRIVPSKLPTGRRRARLIRRWLEAAQTYYPKGFGSTFTVFLFLASLGFGLYRGGHIDNFSVHYGDPRHAIGRALGFGIDSITISGLLSLEASDVLQAAGISPSNSLIFTDAEDVRSKLLALPIVKDAVVRKFFPSKMSIAITERVPYALWQSSGEIYVISLDGTVLDRLRTTPQGPLPFVVGEGAETHVGDYVSILKTAPELASQVRAGMFVSGRRWTLKFNSGLEILLPEEHPEMAFARFAEMQREHDILSKDLMLVDLRLPDRVAFRLSEAAAADRVEKLKALAKAKGGPA